MRTRFELNYMLGLILAMLSCLCLASEYEAIPYRARGQVPPGYQAGYAATIRAAEDEGKLVIYSTTDLRVAKFLVGDFQALYPRIEVEYQDLNSTELHHRFIAETQLGSDSADVLWSSAMDQQFSLVNSGYAQAYKSPETSRLPAWAVWKEQAFDTTYEPIVIAYNKRLLAANEVPHTRRDLIRLLSASPARFKGKVVTYNIEKSGLGFMLAAQDANQSPGFWELARAFGNADARFQLTTEAMLRSVASGRALVAYNVLGSYALANARTNPSVGYVFPKDYTLVTSRVMFISKRAQHPNAAKLWVDYVLSRRGQAVIANRAYLYSVRSDVAGETTAASLQSALGASLKPVPLGPGLIGHLESSKYREFVEQWRQATATR
jgi:iron(III) transport system substrate-binding protein